MPDYELAAERAAKRYKLDPKVFKAMIRQESGFKENVGSSAGARDIAQFMPATAKAYGVTLGDNKVSDDLDGAARYLSENLKKYGTYEKALSVYNSGRPDAYKDPGFAGGQTYNYVKTIMGGSKSEKTSGGSAPKSSPQPSAPTYQSATTTTPGIDNSQQRKLAVASFLQQGGVKNASAVTQLAGTYGQLADVPGTSTTQKVNAPASPSSPTSGLVRVPSGADAALGWAKSKIGFKETGENSGGLASYANQRFGMSNQPWCAMFTSLAVTKGGAPKSARTASVATVRAKAQQGDGYMKGFVDPRSAKSGDLILFGDQHIGMVDHVAGGKIVYVGGNQSNGVTQASVPVGQGDIVRPKYGRRKQE